MAQAPVPASRLARVREFFANYGDPSSASLRLDSGGDAMAVVASEGDAYASRAPVPTEHHPIFNASTPRMQAYREQLTKLPRHHPRMRVNDNLEMIITNTVHSTELINVETRQPYRLPLNHLMLNLMFMASQSNMPRFAKIVQRYGPSRRLTQLIFTTGRMVDTGPEPFEVKRVLVDMLVDMMRESGLHNIGIGRRVCQNIVSTGMLSFPVRLWVLKARYGDRVEYDPAIFPGATIRDPSLVTQVAVGDGSEQAVELERALTALYDPSVPFATIDSRDDEQFDEEEVRQEASAYAHAYVERITAMNAEDVAMRAARGDAEASDAMLQHLVTEQQARIKKTKNMVGLLFANRCLIVGGPKSMKEMLRATTTLYEMFLHCQDTPENRALEEAYLKRIGYTARPPASSPTEQAAPAPTDTAADGASRALKKRRGRPPGSGRGVPKGTEKARVAKAPRKPRKKKETAEKEPKTTIII